MTTDVQPVAPTTLAGNPRVYEPDIAPGAISIIAALVEDGTISEARIDESVGRIRALKQRLSR